MTRIINLSNVFIIKHRDILVYLLLVIVTLAVYWQVQNFNFVNFDDDKYIYENRHVQEGFTLENITWAFTTINGSNWHPLTWLSHMLDCQLYGLNPGWHHLTNLFFHIANTLLLLFIFKKMTGSIWQSAFIAALFALHPLHVELVAWVAERKDVLSTFFWMLTMWSYLWYVESPVVYRYILVVLFLVLGLMSKPMLVTLPFVLLLLDFYPLNRFKFQPSGGSANSQPSSNTPRLILEKIPLFVLVAMSCAITFYAQKKGGAVRSLEIYPFKVRIAVEALTLLMGFVFFNLIVWQSVRGAIEANRIGLVSDIINIPSAPFRIVIAIGALFVALEFLIQLVKLIRHPTRLEQSTGVSNQSE